MIREHDTVVLTRDLPQEGLRAGDIGCVVLIHGEAAGYEVEFIALDGKTLAVVTVTSDAVRPAKSGEIAHVRQVA